MKYHVTLYGEEIEVELTETAEGCRARVGDQEFAVDLSVITPDQRYSILLNEESFDLVADQSGGQLHLQVGSYRCDAQVEDERQRAARSIGDLKPKGPSTLESVMPGVLRAVMVKVGDEVAAGQPLLILEAMKMENEIRAEAPGRVTEVFVSEGDAVDAGARLLALEPLDES